MFATGEGEAEVRAELARTAASGIGSVPTVTAGGRTLFSGALRTELMRAELEAAAARG